MKLTELIISQARERGLRHFFGLPGGGAPLEMLEYGRQRGVDFVSVAHESSAALMAAYYGAMRDTAGLALAIKGVGAGNLVGGAVNAHFERMPVICCCESAPTSIRQQDLVGLCPHDGLFSGIAKYQATLTPARAATQVSEAFYYAAEGRPGPVLLDMPSDLGSAECSESAVLDSPPPSRPPDGPSLVRVRELLEACHRPVFVAGADVLRGGASEELLKVAEKVQAAVLVNMDAHGVFPESHPRWAGTFVGHFNSNTIEGELLERADFALLVGSDSLASDKPWDADMPTCELVPRVEYESLASQPSVRVDGDLKAALGGLLTVPAGAGFSEDEIRNMRQKIDRNFTRPPDARLAAQDIIAMMRESMPEDGVLFSETGIFILMLHHLWPVAGPGRHYATAGGRTMGLMLPAILGAKLARPEVPMVGIGADGSTLMRLGELEVFARTGVAVPLVIINDRALGTMKSRQKARSMPAYALDLQAVDLAAIAKACGLRGVVVDSPEQFKKEFKTALSAERTTLIDARVDPQPYQDSFGPTAGASS